MLAGVMTKALALRPAGKHPLHVVRELEVWPVTVGLPETLRTRVLAGLPRLEKAPTAWSGRNLAADKVLQEIFHTEERITPADVPRLCCGLPGIESCLLLHGREIAAAWNMPVDLRPEVLLTAASGAMDRAAEAGGAGWGEARGITLHLEVASASLLRCGVLQLLALHEKRGFAPGVREKLTMALVAVARSVKG